MEVCDFGDLPTERHRPDQRDGGDRDLGGLAATAAMTADRVSEIEAAGLPSGRLAADVVTEVVGMGATPGGLAGARVRVFPPSFR